MSDLEHRLLAAIFAFFDEQQEWNSVEDRDTKACHVARGYYDLEDLSGRLAKIVEPE